MEINTRRLSQQAHDVALDISKSMRTTKEQAFLYMIESAARCKRKCERTVYEAGKAETLERVKI